MKKMITALVLLLSIGGKSFAQEKKEEPFSFDDRRFTTRYIFLLGNKNRLQLDLKDEEDLKRLPDVDSLLRVFNQDLSLLKDSLSDELTIKKIDYRINASGHKEIRIQQTRPEGSSFLIRGGSLAALKLEQDTVYIYDDFYRVTVIVNRLSELPGLIDGKIDARVNGLKAAKDGSWAWHGADDLRLKTDSTVTEERPTAKWGNRKQPHDVLQFSPMVSIQNYKAYFVPSFDVAADFVLNNMYWKHGNSQYKYTITALWEPQFFFQGGRTFRNDFVGLGFALAKKDPKAGEISPEIFSVSLAYMVGSRGSFYAPNTFRFGLNDIYIFTRKSNISNTRLAPILYFNEFFKGVTPGLRITQHF